MRAISSVCICFVVWLGSNFEISVNETRTYL